MQPPVRRLSLQIAPKHNPRQGPVRWLSLRCTSALPRIRLRSYINVLPQSVKILLFEETRTFFRAKRPN